MDSQSIIEKAKSASRTLLNEIESKALLSEAGYLWLNPCWQHQGKRFSSSFRQ